MVEHRRSPLNSIITMKSVKLESPAKINLMLSVHGQRDDGLHALTSVVAPLIFGDTLRKGLKKMTNRAYATGAKKDFMTK